MKVEEVAFSFEWRRLQVHEQQSERQRKSLPQKALVFDGRAKLLMLEEPGQRYYEPNSV